MRYHPASIDAAIRSGGDGRSGAEKVTSRTSIPSSLSPHFVPKTLVQSRPYLTSRTTPHPKKPLHHHTNAPASPLVPRHEPHPHRAAPRPTSANPAGIARGPARPRSLDPKGVDTSPARPLWVVGVRMEVGKRAIRGGDMFLEVRVSRRIGMWRWLLRTTMRSWMGTYEMVM